GPTEAQLRHAEQVQLVRVVETIVKEARWRDAGEVERAQAAWAKAAPHDDGLAARFDKALARFERQRERYLERVAAVEAKRAEAAPAAEPAPATEPAPAAEPAPADAGEAEAAPAPAEAAPAPEPRRESAEERAEREAREQENLAR